LSRTLLIIKPDATERHLIGHILNRLEKAHFHILDMRLMRLSKDQAQEFYAVHNERPFYNSLVAFLTSGPVVPIMLEKVNAVTDLRILVGATNPEEANCGTIRNEIGLDVEKNSVHASDSDENAAKELSFFFDE